jgi:hypothetical protein
VAAALIILTVAVVVLGLSVLGYNGLVRRRNQVDSAWSQVDMQLRRRAELIPSLVETVDGYAGHERGPWRRSPRRVRGRSGPMGRWSRLRRRARSPGR